MLKLLCGSHTGMVRSANQDNYGGSAEGLAYGFVCDGMGGHNGGETAAELAKTAIERTFGRRPDRKLDARGLKNLIESAVMTANAEIYSRAADDPTLSGMGCTLVLAVVQDNLATLCHVGDSRIYLIRGQELHPLTRDHSLVQEMVDKGKITKDEAEHHPERHYITRALGVAQGVKIEWGESEFLEDDILLLCSDGFHNMVPQQDIPQLCHLAVQNQNAKCLIDSANDQGGEDNITAMLFYSE